MAVWSQHAVHKRLWYCCELCLVVTHYYSLHAAELTQYWHDKYDWRAAERQLNEVLPQFTTVINNMTIHFVHVKSSEPDAIPLILSHGWPGSFVECLKIVPLLSKKGE